MSYAETGELNTAAEIAEARQQFLSEPPPMVDVNDPPEPVVDDAAEEAAALDELTQPPAAPEGVAPAAPPPAPAPAGTPDPFAAFGGEEAVRTAYQVQEALRTESGVRALVANGLTALGYSTEQVRQALDAQEAPTAPAADDPFAGLDDDDVVTVAQTKTLIEQAAQRAAQQAIAATQEQLAPLQQATQQQQATQVRSSTDAAVVEALGPVPTDPAALATYRQQVDAIVQRGQAYYDPARWADPTHVREAVLRAHAEIEAESEARFKAYLDTKKRARDSQPVNTGGGAGGEGPLPEPKNLTEARKQAEAAGFFG